METVIFRIFKKAAYTLRGRHLNRFYFVRTALNFLLRILKPKSVIVDSSRVFLDKDDSMRLSILGIYEPLMVKHFQEKIKKGDVVLDIGAHIGYYTLMAAKRVGRKGQVYAFEPSKDNCLLLRKNLKINGFKNAILVEKAVADSTKKQKLFLNPLSSGMHSLLDLGYKSSSIMIDTVSLDDYFGKNPPAVSVIKMDIEGGEYSALEGMSILLRKNKHLSLFIEFSPFSIKRAKKSPLGFLNLLRNYGFKLYSIDESRNLLNPINKLANFLSNCPVDKDWHINLLAIK